MILALIFKYLHTSFKILLYIELFIKCWFSCNVRSSFNDAIFDLTYLSFLGNKNTKVHMTKGTFLILSQIYFKSKFISFPLVSHSVLVNISQLINIAQFDISLSNIWEVNVWLNAPEQDRQLHFRSFVYIIILLPGHLLSCRILSYFYTMENVACIKGDIHHWGV